MTATSVQENKSKLVVCFVLSELINRLILTPCVFWSVSQQIIATDGGSPQRNAIATVTITITDANNKYPSFLKPFYNTIVDESEFVREGDFIEKCLSMYCNHNNNNNIYFILFFIINNEYSS